MCYLLAAFTVELPPPFRGFVTAYVVVGLAVAAWHLQRNRENDPATAGRVPHEVKDVVRMVGMAAGWPLLIIRQRKR